MIGRIISVSKQLKLISAIILTFAISSCAPQQRETYTGLNIDVKKPVQVALLLPKSHPKTRAVSASLENATLMAVGEMKHVQIHLRIYDTAGNPEQSAIQARKAVDDGAKIILGPLFAESANAAGMAVADQGINVLSFSNNTSVAGGNLFILGKTFQNTSNRLLKYAASKGKTRAVILYPDNIEGKFGRTALETSAKKSNVQVVNTQPFEFTQKGIVNAVPLARASIEVEDADLLLLTSNSAGALPLLGQMLPETGINIEKVQFAGISRWDIPQQTLRLKGLQGGWFTLPDETVRKNFSRRYETLYNQKPHQLAGLAFDGIAAIGALVQTGRPHALTSKGLTQSAGFEGVDGIFRFLKDRTNERGLAIAEIRDKQVYIIDPAPRFFRF